MTWLGLANKAKDAPPTKDVQWEQELHQLVKLQKICASTNPEKKSELPFVYQIFTRLLHNAARGGRRDSNNSTTTHPPSRNAALLSKLFSEQRNREAFLCRSFLFERARGLVHRFQEPPRPEHQMSARLHSLYGMPVLKCGRTRASRMYPFACSKVYDLRQYTADTRWGPFRTDGSDRVDWEKVEAILLVLRSNIHSKGLDGFPVFANFWNTPFAGSWPGSYLPVPLNREIAPLDMEDPYGVSGTWLRVRLSLQTYTTNYPLIYTLVRGV